MNKTRTAIFIGGDAKKPNPLNDINYGQTLDVLGEPLNGGTHFLVRPHGDSKSRIIARNHLYFTN